MTAAYNPALFKGAKPSRFNAGAKRATRQVRALEKGELGGEIILAIVPERLSSQYEVKQYSIQLTLEVLKQIQAEGSLLTPVMIADGRPTTNINSVSYGGRLGFVDIDFSDLDVALKFAMDVLSRNTPVGQGHYRKYRTIHFKDGFVLSIDNKIMPYAAAMEYLKTEADQSTVVSIFNYLPYASSLEDSHSAQAPNGILRLVYSEFLRKFGSLYAVRFAYQRGDTMSARGFNIPHKYMVPVLSFAMAGTFATQAGNTGFRRRMAARAKMRSRLGDRRKRRRSRKK